MDKFPNEFLFGVTTSSFQIEGAWNEDGKGENIWDRLTHTRSDLIRDGTNADISCDYYHKFKEDIKIIKELRLSAYKFSISWSRILPNGNINYINEAGIIYYNEVIDEILKNNIIPMVTLYHYDLPQKLQDIGGWCNPLLVDYFADYAKLMFKLFGDKVKWWTTFNEPSEMIFGYNECRYAPYLSLECFDADYIIAHNVVKAHAKAYRIYDREFRSKQQGKVSIILCGFNFKPKTDSQEDKDAEIRARQFTLGWFAHPIYSEQGDYPYVMRELIDTKSKNEGKMKSKLPQFTTEEIDEIKGSFDYFALNHYSSAVVSNNKMNCKTEHTYRDADVFVEFGDWPPTAAHWCKFAPWGIKEQICWIKNEYNNPPIYVTENGCGDLGDINDVKRIQFLKSYLEEVLKAINEHKCNVIGYNIWTLLDAFEWCNGFRHKYGIVSVDFNSCNRERKLKLSASFVKSLCETRSIPKEKYE